MDEATYQLINQRPVQGQGVNNLDMVNNYFRDPGAQAIPERFWIVPYKRNLLFTKREEVITQLHSLLITIRAI